MAIFSHDIKFSRNPAFFYKTSLIVVGYSLLKYGIIIMKGRLERLFS